MALVHLMGLCTEITAPSFMYLQISVIHWYKCIARNVKMHPGSGGLIKLTLSNIFKIPLSDGLKYFLDVVCGGTYQKNGAGPGNVEQLPKSVF